jgi:hypothetical protein
MTAQERRRAAVGLHSIDGDRTPGWQPPCVPAASAPNAPPQPARFEKEARDHRCGRSQLRHRDSDVGRLGLNSMVVAPANDGSTVITGSTCDWKVPSAPAAPQGAERIVRS